MPGNRIDGLPDRFRLIAEIGAGAYKKVWWAKDELLRRDVAVASFTSTEDLEFALAEARRMAVVSDHPRIVTIYDVLDLADCIVFILRFLEGGDLSGRSKIESATRYSIARQICEGIKHIHASGYVHGDLKPANVLLDNHLNAFVTDFGMSRMAPRDEPGEVGGGTPMYMAPEVVRGHSPGIASDFYALGCILYELFAGRPAFSGNTTEELYRAHLETRPTVLHLVNSEVSATLSDIVSRLLIKSPEHRCVEIERVTAALTKRIGGHRNWARNSVFVGRKSELRCLRESFATAKSDGFSSVLVEGEAGFGKSALLLEALAAAEDQGYVTVFIRGLETGRFPYTAVATALRGCFEDLAALGDAETIAGFLGIHHSSANDLDQSALATFGAFSRLIEAVPVAVVADDLQWLDEHSRRFVVELLDLSLNLEPKGLFFAGAIRTPVDAGEGGVLNSALERLPNVRRIPLSGLADTEVVELIRQKYGSQVSGRELEEICRVGGGNPLYVSTAFGSQMDRSSLSEVLLRKLGGISSAGRSLLRIAAIVPRDPNIDLLADVLGIYEKDVLNLLVECEGVGVIDAQFDSIRFSHPLYRTLIVRGWGRLGRQQMEARLASVLSRSLEDNPGLVAEYADHLVRAGRFADGGELARVAADAVQFAARMADWSLVRRICNGRLGDGSQVSDAEAGFLHYMLAMSDRNQNDLVSAVREFDKAIELMSGSLSPELVMAHKYRLTTLSFSSSGAVDTEALEQVLAQLERSQGRAWALAKIALADIRLDQLDPESAREMIEAVLGSPAFTSLDDEDQSSVYNVLAGANEQLMAFEDAVHSFSKSLDHATASERPHRMNEVLCQMPRPHFFLGRLEDAEALVERAVEIHQETRNHRQLMRALAVRVSIHIQRGQLADAWELAKEMQGLLERTAFHQLSGDVVFAAAQIQFLSGRFDLAFSSIEQLISGGHGIARGGPFVSVGNLYAELIRRSEDREHDMVELRHPRPVIAGRIDPFRVGRVCLNVLLAGANDEVLLRESVGWLNHAHGSGQLFTGGWSFFLPQVIGSGYIKLGQTVEAREMLDLALATADDIGARMSAYLSAEAYANMLKNEGVEFHSMEEEARKRISGIEFPQFT